MPTIEDMKRKLSGLFSKTTTNGATEAEAASALALAKKLMGEWNISEADVAKKADGSSIVEHRLKPRSKPPLWEMEIGLILRELFSVEAYSLKKWYETKDPKARNKWVQQESLVLVGTKADVQFAEEMFTILKAQILKMSARYVEETGCSFAERSRFGRGVVARLLQRVREAQASAKVEDDARCRALVVSKLDDARAWLKDNVKFRKPRASRQEIDDHFFEGHHRGDQVDFGLGKKSIK